ncbi:MAG: SURF1 family protein [Dokdonella sp.]
MAGALRRRWRRPSWFAIALVCFGVAAFSYLGVWQLHRAAEKKLLLLSYAGAASAPTISLGEARSQTNNSLNPHVSVSGRFDTLHGYLLDDQIREGRQGVLAFALFEPDDGSLPLLINRGFIDRAQSSKLPALPDGEIRLSGLYAPAPGSGLRLGGNSLPGQDHWPKLSIYIDLAEIAEDLQRKIDSRILLLDADPASGFVREWTPQVMSPDRHRGYAFQWFCFVIAAIVIFIVLHWRRETNEPK